MNGPQMIGELSARERIDRRSEWDPNTGCQLWFGPTDRYGYPCLTYRQKHTRAHRLSILDSLGLTDTDLHVMHKCHTPACVNPEHLALGTHTENMNDVKVRAQPRPYSRVTPSLKAEMARRASERQPVRQIARDMGFDPATVRYHTERSQ